MDKATDVGIDTSVDLLKYRLPYLESELSFHKDGLTAMTESVQNRMIARIQYNATSPRRRSRANPPSNIENAPMQTQNAPQPTKSNLTKHNASDDSQFANKNAQCDTKLSSLSQAILDSLSDGVRSPLKQIEDTKLPALSANIENFGDKSFKLNGVGLCRSQSMREPPTFIGRSPMLRSPMAKSPRSKVHIKSYLRSPPKTPKSGSSRSSAGPEYSLIHRSKTEQEIIDQAKKMLNESGLDGDRVLQQDVQRLGRGLSELYLTDFGLNEERIDARTGMCGRKSIPHDHEYIPDAMEHTAQRHIYMCQIPSLLNRSSVARAHVRNLKATLKPRFRAARQFQGRFAAQHASRVEESPRPKPLLLFSEKTFLPDPKRSIYKSHESLYRSNDTLYKSKDNLSVFSSPFDVQGTPMHIMPTKERVL